MFIEEEILAKRVTYLNFRDGACMHNTKKIII